MDGDPQKTKSVFVRTSEHYREIPIIVHQCAAGADCPYCGGTFEGAKQARYCCRAATMWHRRKLGKDK